MLEKPCKEWTKARSGKGYGQKWCNGRLQYVHRLTWEEHHGPLAPGEKVLHHCDNPPCYEITHLFKGSQLDNMRDGAAKGRVGGKRRVDRDELVRRYLAGEKSADLAIEFGVHQMTVARYARQVDPVATRARKGRGRWC